MASHTGQEEFTSLQAEKLNTRLSKVEAILSAKAETIDQVSKKLEKTFELQRSFYSYDDLFRLAQAHLSTIKVAILDSGCYSDHQDLQPPPQPLSAADTTDSVGHGTQVAGLIAGSQSGIAPGVQLLVAKVTLGTSASLDYDAIKTALGCAIEQEVDFVNMSIGKYFKYDSEIERLLLRASVKGIVIIVSAGNDGTTKVQNVAFPGNCGCVISVGSHTLKGTPSPLSPIGEIDIVALGTEVWSTWNQGPTSYKRQSGTSFAAAFVTGLCCLLKGYAKSQNFTELLSSTHVYKHIFRKLCLNLRGDTALGGGIIQLQRIAADPDYYKELLQNAV
ncbi:S8/S53 family peptidase [Patescibacteria group bacterium]|nr:S8/S53 family peptidase [Patescibacteria group bacterium]